MYDNRGIPEINVTVTLYNPLLGTAGSLLDVVQLVLVLYMLEVPCSAVFSKVQRLIKLLETKVIVSIR